MKLQLNRKTIHPDLFEELVFEDYLKFFEYHLPFLSTIILNPMNKEQGIAHFNELHFIEELIEKEELKLTDLLSLCARILPLENSFPSLKAGGIEQYQLYLIYTYIVQELLLLKEEVAAPLKIHHENLENIKNIILDFCEEGAKVIRFSSEEKLLKESIYQNDKKLEQQLQEHERIISESTGLSLLYPYPRELLRPSEELLLKVTSCPKLTIEKKGELYILQHKLAAETLQLESEVQKLREQLESEVKKRLTLLGQQLSPFIDDLIFAYEQRKKRAYLYALCYATKKHKLSLPTFIDSGFYIQNAHLPCLEKANLENYVPLSLELEKEGAHVLFGANMAGKTSVLKTLYFILSLVRMGLPLPVENVTLRYPEKIEIHLKNSGKIKQKLSGFADELTFFSQEFAPGSYLLVDELFHSTNPLAGLELSKVFLSHFAQQELLLFCTSFYPEVLYMKDIFFYKMLDASLDVEDERPVNDVLSQTPFRVEKLHAQDVGKSFWESQQPLKLALHFPLNEELKKNIKLAIKE